MIKIGYDFVPERQTCPNFFALKMEEREWELSHKTKYIASFINKKVIQWQYVLLSLSHQHTQHDGVFKKTRYGKSKVYAALGLP